MGIRGMLFALAVAGGAVTGCTAAPGPSGEMASGSPEELGSALNVTVGGDSVQLELHVTNATNETLRLEFPSAQRYDFAVLDSAGGEVWRWSSDMMFAQVVGAEDLLPGESRRYMASWLAADRAGDYVAEGVVTSNNYPVLLRTPFRLPVE